MASSYIVDKEAVRKQLDRLGEEYTFRLIPISEINVQPIWQEAKMVNIRKALKEKTPLPPIRAAIGAKGKYEIDDGIHRVNAAIEAGLTHIPAFIPKSEEYKLGETRKITMRKELKKRLEVVASSLDLVFKSAASFGELTPHFNALDQKLRELANEASDAQSAELLKARDLVISAWKVVMAAAKASQTATAEYVHDPMLLIRHEEEAKKKLEQLNSPKAKDLRNTYQNKLKELIDNREVTPDDVQDLLHVFDKK